MFRRIYVYTYVRVHAIAVNNKMKLLFLEDLEESGEG